jgi:hypothetical protein
MSITIGRLVHYTLSEYDAKKINKRRLDALEANRSHTEDGVQIHVGNPPHEGDVLPMVVVKTYEDSDQVNGQVYLDGNDTYWVTSVPQSMGLIPATGCWHWPFLD